MKIVAVLENNIYAGGGFNQSLNAILQINRISQYGKKFTLLVKTSHQENIELLSKFGISAEFFKLTLADRVLKIMALTEPTKRILRRLKYQGPFERKLSASGCDLIYFLMPTDLIGALQKLNYIATVWDLSHRDSPEFPEVREYGEIASRDYFYQNYLAPAYLIIVDSIALVERLHFRYGIDRDRMLVMPFSPNPVLHHEIKENRQLNLAEIYGIGSGYFFYPAQFWPHKNHKRIIDAIKLMHDRGNCYSAVFVGGDKGNLHFLKEYVLNLRLQDYVHFLGFVPSEHLGSLYKNSIAVVMPTYFGHTNIPPLEAWLMERPLIYTNYLIDDFKDAALAIDPDDASTIADAMYTIKNSTNVMEMIEAGKKKLKKIDLQKKQAEQILENELEKFVLRRSLWQ